YLLFNVFYFFFFFSSRRRHTRLQGDWSSDVCSSDLVEHDPDVMRSADHILDLGPGAGEHGGRIVFEGSYPHLIRSENTSLTAKYLRGDLKTSHLNGRRVPNPKRVVRFLGAQAHNLKA